jgi:hypothetical protein
MNLIFKCLVAIILVLCIFSVTTVVAYYATTYKKQMEAHDITSEGPNCRTIKWYVMDAVARFDDVLCECCNTVGNDELLVAWRTWLQNKFNVTMY